MLGFYSTSATYNFLILLQLQIIRQASQFVGHLFKLCLLFSQLRHLLSQYMFCNFQASLLGSDNLQHPRLNNITQQLEPNAVSTKNSLINITNQQQYIYIASNIYFKTT